MEAIPKSRYVKRVRGIILCEQEEQSYAREEDTSIAGEQLFIGGG